jgi:hypothetical protein
MSLTPENVPQRELASSAGMPFEARGTPETKVRRRWLSRLLGVCFALFAFEVGLFLLVFPWMDSWNFNYFQDLSPSIQDFWSDPYFRGALSGLGLVNIYIACREFIHVVRRIP